MQESQSIEWKWTWQDEYLKWLCGYANTDGGTLYIGVNDDGYVVGVKDSKMLLESLPNKINDKLGIIVSIKVYTEQQGANVRYDTYDMGCCFAAGYAGGRFEQRCSGCFSKESCCEETHDGGRGIRTG
ncbi:MAG: ATP-binding protein [Clostridiales bacterium]|nr:ATP-binding protein [Clostridiales bacterium]